MMSSCCTLRLKRRRAFSRDSLSWIITSATLNFTPNPVRIGFLRRLCTWRTPSLSISIACKSLLCSRHLVAASKGRISRWHLLINSRAISQVFFRGGPRRGCGSPVLNHLRTELLQWLILARARQRSRPALAKAACNAPGFCPTLGFCCWYSLDLRGRIVVPAAVVYGGKHES